MAGSQSAPTIFKKINKFCSYQFAASPNHVLFWYIVSIWRMKNLINFAKEIGGVYKGYNDGNMSNINHFYHGKGKCERIQQQKIGKMERNHNISRKKINELHPDKVIFSRNFKVRYLLHAPVISLTSANSMLLH